jgi:hypothetical protein
MLDASGHKLNISSIRTTLSIQAIGKWYYGCQSYLSFAQIGALHFTAHESTKKNVRFRGLSVGLPAWDFSDQALPWLLHGNQSFSNPQDLLIPFTRTYK